MEIPECEMTKAQFLAMPNCANRDEAVAMFELECLATRYKLSTGEWVCLMPDEDVRFVTVLPTVPRFLRAGRNVSW